MTDRCTGTPTACRASSRGAGDRGGASPDRPAGLRPGGTRAPVVRLLGARARDRSAASRPVRAHLAGDSFQDPQANAAQLLSTVRKLQARPGATRGAPQGPPGGLRALGRVGRGDFLVSNEVPTNLVLGVTDLLVTDYSSVLFDFLPRSAAGALRARPRRVRRRPRALPGRVCDLLGPTCGPSRLLIELVQQPWTRRSRSSRAKRAGDCTAPEDGAVYRADRGHRVRPGRRVGATPWSPTSARASHDAGLPRRDEVDGHHRRRRSTCCATSTTTGSTSRAVPHPAARTG